MAPVRGRTASFVLVSRLRTYCSSLLSPFWYYPYGRIEHVAMKELPLPAIRSGRDSPVGAVNPETCFSLSPVLVVSAEKRIAS